MLKLGDSNIMMADAWPGNWEQGPKESASASMWLNFVSGTPEPFHLPSLPAQLLSRDRHWE